MPTAFLDRDGVINRRIPGDYVKCWPEFHFLPGVREALHQLRVQGFRLIVVSNQRGVSLGKMQESDVRVIHDTMQAELRRHDAGFDAIYYCPHDIDSCDCRKPQIGMFLRAKRDFSEIEFAESYVIGDSASDMEAGARIGAKLILVGGELGPAVAALGAKNIRVDYLAPSLLEAVQHYLAPRVTP